MRSAPRRRRRRLRRCGRSIPTLRRECNCTRSSGTRSISAMDLRKGIDALAVRPDGQCTVLEFSDGARRDRSHHASGRDADSSPSKLRAPGLACAWPSRSTIASERAAAADTRRDRLGREASPASSQCAAAESARIATIASNSRSATTARKLPSRTTLSTPGIFSIAAVSQLRAGARRSSADARRARAPCRENAGPAHRPRRPSPWPECRRAASTCRRPCSSQDP